MEDGTKRSSNLGGELAKDGRKISVGDCALFQAINAPPFIGIIRSLSADVEGNAKLGVNWLYRPPDVKLGKGVLLDAAPNEIFYSFHKDEIPATSLLHPCKVAFLRKGVELPSGVSSFVCRRVYDTASKCLWWLTDRDYSDEHQEEVDELLNRTRHDMKAALQSGGPSPRTLNAHVSTQQLKSSSESIHSAACLSQDKKTECADLHPVKKEHYSKPDDVDAVPSEWEWTALPGEITNITDVHGSLTSSAGVEHLVHLMQQDIHDSTKRGTELASWRTMIVGVIANTDRDDCLSLFVQLGGLLILDDWLQVAHKGKSGGVVGPQEGEKFDEELLLTLLRALDKLPVDLNALKTCNIGKSVNHLRNHKNVEIKKRARCLVDTWKKRVDAEMKNGDTSFGSNQCVSWPCKQALVEEVHLQCKGGGSAEAVLKSSSLLTSSVKPVSGGSGQGDVMENSTSTPPGSVKVSALSPSTHNSKDYPSKDSKNSTAGSMTAKASTSSGSCHKLPSKGILGSGMSGKQKEAGGLKSPVQNKNTVGETASQSGSAFVKEVDSGSGDSAPSQRLTIRLPNAGHGLICGMPEECDADDVFHVHADPEINTELSQSMHPKTVVTGGDDRGRSTSPIEVEGRGSDCKEAGKWMEICKVDQPALSRSGEQIDSEEGLVETENIEPSVQGGTPSGSIKGCSKPYEPAEVGMYEDRMNLLACGAASENSKVTQVSVAGTSERASFPTGEGDFYQETKLRCSAEASLLHLDNNEVDESTVSVKEEKDDAVSRDDPDAARNHVTANTSTLGLAAQHKDASGLSTRAFTSTHNTDPDINVLLDGLVMNPSHECLLSEHNSAGNGINVYLPNQEAEESVEAAFGSGGKPNMAVRDEISDAFTEQVTAETFSGLETRDDKKQSWLDVKSMVGEENKQDVGTSLGVDIKAEDIAGEEEMVMDHGMTTRPSDSDVKNTSKGITGFHEDSTEVALQFVKKVDEDVDQYGKPLGSTSPDKVGLDVSTSHQLKDDLVNDSNMVDAKQCCSSEDEIKERQDDEDSGSQDLDNGQDILTEKKEDTTVEKVTEHGAGIEVDEASYSYVGAGNKIVARELGPGLAFDLCEDERSDIDHNDVSRFPSNSDVCVGGPTVVVSSVLLTQPIKKLSVESVHADELDAPEHLASEAIISKEEATIGSDTTIRPEFDLNKGVAMDEANQDDSTIHTVASAPTLLLPTSDSIATISNGLATPIAVVAVTKGSFIPPVNPLRSKVELGWKGSAATSAFRPAEPQRTPEKQHLTSESGSVDAVSDDVQKQSRPFLDIDLNVTDKIVVEDVGIPSVHLSSQKSVPVTGPEQTIICGQELMTSTSDQSAFSGLPCSAGRLSFDLNCVDESEENGLATAPHAKSSDNLQSSFRTVLSGSSRILRDFDLNDGPALEDAGNGHTSQEFNAGLKGSSYLHAVTGMKENEELVNVPSCFPSGNTFSASASPLSSARIEQPFRVDAAAAVQSISSSANGPISFSGDLYKGELVLASACPAPYSKPVAASFPYAGSSFELNLPFISTSLGGTTSYVDSSGLACFAGVPTQCAGAVSSASLRTYSLNLTNSSCIASNNARTRPDLDLNAGPETVDMEMREEVLSSRRPSITGSQVSLERKGAFFPAATSGVPSKRKEPEGGWDLHKTGYRQSTWQ